MLYFNKNKESVEQMLSGVDINNVLAVQQVLTENGVDFASIRVFEDNSIEIIHNGDHLLLGPCGGVNGLKGKWVKYDSFDYDLDEFDEVLKDEISTILSGNVDVVNLGN